MSEVNEALKGLDEAKRQLDSVKSWVYAHPDVWESFDAEEIAETIELIKADIDNLKDLIRETARK